MTSPKLAKTTYSGRTYRHPITQVEYPSVTTVLGIVGKADALKHWAANEVAKYAVKYRDTWSQLDDAAAVDLLKREPLRFLDKAASRGTDVHALAEAYAKTGVMPQWAAEIDGYVAALRLFFDQHRPEPVLVEHTVFNSVIGYAGSFDLVCRMPAFGGDLVILDYKTSKAVYPDVAAQLAAYAYGEEYIDDLGKPLPMLPIKRGVVVRLASDCSYEVVECDLAQGWTYFKEVRDVFGIETKTLLIGNVEAPAGVAATQDAQTRERLITRITWLKQNNPAAAAQLADEFARLAMPTFKSGHQHNTSELAAITRMLNKVEADHNVPFHAAFDAPAQTQVEQPPAAAASEHLPPMASDEIGVDPTEVTRVRERLAATDEATRNTVRQVAQQANRAKRNISLQGKPSLRRVLLAEMLISAVEDGNGKPDVLEAVLRHLELRSTRTLGYDVGSLDIDNVTKVSNLLDAIRKGTVDLQYDSDNDTFTISEQKGKQT
jgi:hypothetical protein